VFGCPKTQAIVAIIRGIVNLLWRLCRQTR